MSALKGGIVGWALRRAARAGQVPRHKRNKVRCPVCNRKVKLSKAGLFPNHYGGGVGMCAASGREPS